MADSQLTSASLPRELYQWLAGEAKRRGVSQARIIVYALMEYRDQLERNGDGQ
jgi:hypothetical protein